MPAPLHILIVDDDRLDRLSVVRALGEHLTPLQITEASDLAQARRALAHQRFHCAILDHELPDGDGLTLLQELAPDRLGEMAVLLLTARDGGDLGLRATRLGAEDYLHKRVLKDDEGFSYAVRRAIERSRARSRRHSHSLFTTSDTYGRYELLEEVGAGGMARVFKVRHLDNGGIYALKMLLSQRSLHRERLLREGRIQSSLSHPNVVRVHEVLDGELPALVMDYVDGPCLKEWITRAAPQLPEIETLFLEILDGVSHFHRRGVVHRDLKPANILLELRGDGWRPRITDFGLVKPLREALHHQTVTGATMGTPAYMAPEQISDAKSVDHRADIYSLGCVLYELICRRPPFADRNPMHLLNAVSVGAYPGAETLVSGLPDRFARTLHRCLALNPDQRFQDCQSLRESLLGDRHRWIVPMMLDEEPSLEEATETEEATTWISDPVYTPTESAGLLPTRARRQAPDPDALPDEPPDAPALEPPLEPTARPAKEPSRLRALLVALAGLGAAAAIAVPILLQ